MVLDYPFIIEKALVAPLHVRWGIDLPQEIRAFLYAGPSFQYGLACEAPSGLSNVPAFDMYEKEDYGLANLYEYKYLKSCRSLWKAGVGLEF